MSTRRLPILLALIYGFFNGWTTFFVIVFTFAIWGAWRWYYEEKKSVTIPDHALLRMSTIKLGEMIKKREISSVELVELFIKQIERVNPLINAVVAKRYEAARREAQLADNMTASTADTSELPPLHGVPCTIKECFAVESMPNTSGLRLRKDVVAEADAVVVKRLREAGAIVLGVTNTSELCMWMESSNNVYGRTCNPYDTRRIVGGSSGGEGAILTACGAPFGLGSDVGGSIRMPCFFNGIFGHKPSGGLVPNTGQFPDSSPKGVKYLSTGPMCKKAEDLMPLLKIMYGKDAYPIKIRNPEEVDVSRLTFYSVRQGPKGFLYKSVSQDMRDAQLKVEDYLRSIGANVQVIDYIEEIENTFAMWSACISEAGNHSFGLLMGNLEPSVSSPLELLKWFLDFSEHTFPAIGLAILENVPRLFPASTKASFQEATKLKTKIEKLLDKDGIMLFPSYPVPAPRHHSAMAMPVNWVYNAVFNVLQFPVTQVPLGLNNAGLPLGIQVASVEGNDGLTIAVALELEKKFGGWVPPS